MSRRRAARVLALGAAMTVLVGCQPHPDCSYTDCGTVTGHVVGVGADGRETWRVPVADSVADTWQVTRYETRDPSTEHGPKPVLLAEGDRVVVDGCAAVHVLDAATGATLLETAALARAWAVVGGLVVGVKGDAVIALPVQDGVVGWRVTRPGGREPQSPVGVAEVGGDLAVAWEESLTVVSPDGTHRATAFTAQVAGPPVALDDHTVLVPALGGTVTAVDTRTGSLRWSVDPDGPLTDVDTRMYRLGDDVLVAWTGRADELARVGPDGAVRWRTEAELPPLVALAPDATLVLGRLRGATEAIDLTTGERARLGVEVPPRLLHSTSTAAGVVVTGRAAAPLTGVAWSGTGPQPVPVPWEVRGRVEGVAGPHVVVQGEASDEVLGVDLATGEARWRVPVEHLWASSGTGYNGGPLVRGVGLDGGTTVVADLPQELTVSVTCDVRGPRRTVEVLPPPDR